NDCAPPRSALDRTRLPVRSFGKYQRKLGARVRVEPGVIRHADSFVELSGASAIEDKRFKIVMPYRFQRAAGLVNQGVIHRHSSDADAPAAQGEHHDYREDS